MPWFKVDDGFATSEPVMRVKRRYRASVIGLWTLSGTWCAKELTDGRVPFHMIDELACTTAQADQLVGCGLWADHPEGYVFIGWEKYQPTRAKVEAERQKETERKANYRMSRRDTAGTPPGVPLVSQPVSGHPDPTRPDPSLTTSKEVEKTPPRKRGSRVDPKFKISDEMRAWAVEAVPLVSVTAKLPEFIDYWAGVAGAKGVKDDWVATWRNGMRTQQRFAEGDKAKTQPAKANRDAWMNP